MQDSRKVHNITCREFQVVTCIQWWSVGLTWAQVLTGIPYHPPCVCVFRAGWRLWIYKPVNRLQRQSVIKSKQLKEMGTRSYRISSAWIRLCTTKTKPLFSRFGRKWCTYSICLRCNTHRDLQKKPPAHTKLVISTSQRCLQPTNSHLLQIAVSNATLVAHKPLVSSQRELEANSPSQWRSSSMSAVTCHVPHFTVPTFKLTGFNMYKCTSTRVLRGCEFIFPSVGFPSVNPLQLSLIYSVQMTTFAYW